MSLFTWMSYTQEKTLQNLKQAAEKEIRKSRLNGTLGDLISSSSSEYEDETDESYSEEDDYDDEDEDSEYEEEEKVEIEERAITEQLEGETEENPKADKEAEETNLPQPTRLTISKMLPSRVETIHENEEDEKEKDHHDNDDGGEMQSPDTSFNNSSMVNDVNASSVELLSRKRNRQNETNEESPPKQDRTMLLNVPDDPSIW